jgi:hypothetical protein
MSEYIFDLVAFFDKAPVAPDFRRAALQSLGECTANRHSRVVAEKADRPTSLTGFLFRGYPTLMVEPSSLIVMDSVFASTDAPTKAVLLDVIHDFLLTQVERVKKEPGSAAVRGASFSKETDLSLSVLGLTRSSPVRSGPRRQHDRAHR